MKRQYWIALAIIALIGLFIYLNLGYQCGAGWLGCPQYGKIIGDAGGPGYGMGQGMGMMRGYGGLGFRFGLLFWLLVAAFLYLLFSKENGKSVEIIETPMDILNKRYALGEISKEEYDQKKKEIIGD